MLDPIRNGIFTASEFHKLMTVEKKPEELPSGAITHVYKKVAETLCINSEELNFVSASMQHGIDCEGQAVLAFTEKTGIDVYNWGDDQQVIVDDNVDSPFFGEIAGTPDGRTLTSGVEIKCPDKHTHLFNLLHVNCAESFKKHYPEYYWQVHGYMLLAEAPSWYFVSYDPRYFNHNHRIKIINIERNENDINFLKTRLNLGVNLKRQLIKQLEEIK